MTKINESFEDSFAGGHYGWQEYLANGGTAYATYSDDAFGAVTIQCGSANANGRACIARGTPINPTKSGPFEYMTRINLAKAPDATTDFIFRAGLGDSTAGDHNYGLYFEIDRTISNDFLIAVAKNGAGNRTQQITDYRIANLVKPEWQWLCIEHMGDKVCYEVNERVVAVLSTNIPTSYCGLNYQLLGIAGSNDRALKVDHVKITKD
jgi:hypothetical protein